MEFLSPGPSAAAQKSNFSSKKHNFKFSHHSNTIYSLNESLYLTIEDLLVFNGLDHLQNFTCVLFNESFVRGESCLIYIN